ncbi:MAG: hypothetical protein KGL19_12375 [Bacteroidota bacterium]|nr:hypothetical protein [Bacteroidota bacterium]
MKFKYLLLTILLLAQLSTTIRAQECNKEILNSLSSSNFSYRPGQWDGLMPMTMFPWVKKQLDGKEFNYFLQTNVTPIQGRILIVQAAAGDAIMEGKRQNNFSPDKVIDYVSMKKFAPKGKNNFAAPEPCGRPEFPLLYHVKGRQGEMQSEGYAGYAKGYAVYFIASYGNKEFPLTSEWVQKAFFDWLTPLPNLEMAQVQFGSNDTKIIMLPAFPKNIATNICLIPASELLPAKIEYKGLPEKTVEVILPDDALGELKYKDQKGKSLTIKPDNSGSFTCYFYFTGKAEVTKRITYEVRFRQDGKTEKGYINVGLGLEVTRIKQVQGSFDQYAVNTPYPFVIQLKSTFYPDLELGLYLSNAEKEDCWNGNTLGLFADCEWLNRSADITTNDEIYRGTCNIKTYGSFTDNVASANDSPYYHAGGTVYPSIVLKTGGQHIYGIKLRPVIIKVADHFQKGKPYLECNNEPLLKASTIVGLSAVEPDTWFNVFQDMACSFDATSWQQSVSISLIKAIPVYGKFAERFLTGASIICKFTKGNYGDAFLELVDAMGKEYLDHLTSDEVLPLLNPREQQLAKLAKDVKDVLEASVETKKLTEDMLSARKELKEKIDKLYLESNYEFQ